MLISAVRQVTKSEFALCFLFVILASYFTYFHNYHLPQAVYWDENYHIASAQKYLNGIYYMEQHPPLGKMLIALGEKILNRNPDDGAYIDTDYATSFPEDFSFAGYRFFPALLAWLTAPVLFLAFSVIARRPLLAVLLSFLYIFDNALIVHLRGAMLEGPLLFFVALTILFFLLLLRSREWPQYFSTLSLWFGISLALVAVTKLLGVILVLLIPVLLYALFPDGRATRRFLVTAGFGFFLMYFGMWYLHFAIGARVHPPLPDNGYYQASDEFKKILDTGRTRSLLAFPVMLRDSLKFVTHYNGGVPRLNLCKVDENGSPFYFWPFGARSISYRWETPDSYSYKYLYLQVNPVVWFAGFLGIVLASSLLLSSFLFEPRTVIRERLLLLTFLGLYIAYMVVMSRIDRVMYLYHYFIPLLFSFFLFALVLMELPRLGAYALTLDRKAIGLLGFAVLLFISFQFYRPLTYYEPLSDEQFQRRNLLSFWNLQCVRCERQNGIFIPSQ